MINVKNISKKYGNFKALDDVSFEIEKGHIYGLLGPNGAGKSTTMNIITGYISASSGTVEIDGHDIVKEPINARKLIGYLPEIPPLYMDMTVYEYLKFVTELKKVKRSERQKQIEDVMEQMQITEYADKLISKLSKGYRQRVGFAQALIGNPEILILDEPSVGLDPKQIIEMRNIITDLGKNHTVILSSHIFQEISAVCEYLMIINHGKLIANGSVDEILALSDSGNVIEIKLGTTRDVSDSFEKLKEKYTTIMSFTVDVNENTTTVALQLTKDGVDIRKALLNDLMDMNMEILDYHTKENTIEKVFLELIEDSDEAEEMDAGVKKAEDAVEKAHDKAGDADGRDVKDELTDNEDEDFKEGDEE